MEDEHGGGPGRYTLELFFLEGEDDLVLTLGEAEVARVRLIDEQSDACLTHEYWFDDVVHPAVEKVGWSAVDCLGEGSGPLPNGTTYYQGMWEAFKRGEEGQV